MKSLILTGLVLMLAVCTACVKSDSIDRAAAFEVEPLDACLAIVIDMSGSFSESWGDRAHRVFLNVADRFFTESLGGNSRLVVAQMSQRQDFILWEGTPEEMRAKFPSPEVFNRFLKDQSDPQSSPVYEATEEAVNYVSAVHGVAPSTRLLTVILSDMIDSSQDPQEKQASGNRMLAALQGYQQRGGSLALYCVAPEETRRWQRIVDMAGFKSGQFVIQSSLVENPILPKLD